MEAEVLHLTILLWKGRVEEGPRPASVTSAGGSGFGLETVMNFAS